MQEFVERAHAQYPSQSSLDPAWSRHHVVHVLRTLDKLFGANPGSVGQFLPSIRYKLLPLEGVTAQP